MARHATKRLGAFFCGLALASCNSDHRTQSIALRDVVSPDGRLHATVWADSTGVQEFVTIQRTGRTRDDVGIVTRAYARASNESLFPRWVSTSQIEIAIPIAARIEVPEQNDSGVHVTRVVYPYLPQVRTAFLDFKRNDLIAPSDWATLTQRADVIEYMSRRIRYRFDANVVTYETTLHEMQKSKACALVVTASDHNLNQLRMSILGQLGDEQRVYYSLTFSVAQTLRAPLASLTLASAQLIARDFATSPLMALSIDENTLSVPVSDKYELESILNGLMQPPFRILLLWETPETVSELRIARGLELDVFKQFMLCVTNTSTR